MTATTNAIATPLDVFKLARRQWLAGQRICVGELAKELGIGRAKVYRWVGSKELLLDEIIWSMAKPTFEKSIQATSGAGIYQIVGVHRHFMTTILSFPPLQQFIHHDPPYALRILSKDAVSAHERLIAVTAKHMAEQAAAGHIQLPRPAEQLAEMIIRTNESVIYYDIISGQSPAIERACHITRLLLS
ncbi:MAG: transcriptional regulator [Desulfatitalea sp.]|nr:transcriptional regulator [Desulfatitalea sp.]